MVFLSWCWNDCRNNESKLIFKKNNNINKFKYILYMLSQDLFYVFTKNLNFSKIRLNKINNSKHLRHSLIIMILKLKENIKLKVSNIL